MSSTIEQIQQIVSHDLDPDLVRSVSIALGWEYQLLFEKLYNNDSLTDAYREEEFNRRRGSCAVNAMTQAAKMHGVPFEFQRLDCNGQQKLLVKSGRVVIIQEPITTLRDQPEAADYKRDLADTHGYVRQLELDLGDQPHRIRDWSGCVFAVLLHGPAGAQFCSDQKSLGSIMLAVPDASYRQWVLRLDLHNIAMFGRGEASPDTDRKADRSESTAVQEDNVVVTPKKRNSARNTA